MVEDFGLVSFETLAVEVCSAKRERNKLTENVCRINKA